MAVEHKSTRILSEIAAFLASFPSRQKLLRYRPSRQLQKRASELLWKNNAGNLNDEEKRELDEMVHAEMLMRLIKARLRAQKVLRG